MDSLKNILIAILFISAIIMFFKPAQYADPIFIGKDIILSDSLKQKIVNDANRGYIVGTEDELARRFSHTKTVTKNSKVPCTTT